VKARDSEVEAPRVTCKEITPPRPRRNGWTQWNIFFELLANNSVRKEDIMKTSYGSPRLIAIVLVLAAAAIVWTTLPARQVHAIQDSEDFPSPFGLAQGQTARLTLLNIGEVAVVGPEYRFLNSRGETLARSAERIVILPGQFRSFDFDLPNPPPGIVDFLDVHR
jgi:hypothetical protein